MKASLSLAKLIWTTGVAFSVVVVVLFISGSELFDLAEKRLEDVWYRIEPRSMADERIVVVEIDDATLEYYFPEIPIPRGQIALLIDGLMAPEVGAGVVATDLYFEGPDRIDLFNDTLLGNIIGLHRDAFVGALFFSDLWEHDGPDTANWPNALSSFSYNIDHLSCPRGGSANLPPQLLLKNSSAYGHINVDKDETGILRNMPIFVRYGGATIGSLALEALRQYLGLQRSDVTHTKGRIDIGPYYIPVDRTGTVRVRYYCSHTGYNRISMIDLLGSLKEESISSTYFRDKIVLIGIASKIYYPKEYSFTPYGDERPNVYLHADLISNFMAGRFLVDAQPWLLPMMAVILGLIYCLVHFLKSRLKRLLISLFSIIAAVLIDMVLFRSGVSMQVIPLIFIGLPLTVYTYFVSFWEQVDIIKVQEQETLSLRKKEESLVAIEHEIKVARAIQEHLLPQSIPKMEGYDIYGANSAAKGVSGDLFDMVSLRDGEWAIMVADVSGKGISASLLMAASLSVLRSESLKRTTTGSRASEIISQANSMITSITDPARFVTLFYLILDAGSGRMECVNAGHNPPLLVEQLGATRPVEGGDVVLGAIADLDYSDKVLYLEPGQKIVIYTDGVVEAENRQEEQYGDERLAALVRDNYGLSSRELVEAVIEDVNKFANGADQSDDITIVVLGRDPLVNSRTF